MSTIAIQGIKGSFHDQASRKLIDAQSVECVTFQDVFNSVINSHTDYGVVAIENSLHGSINPVYRLLERHNLWIAGETTLNIEQYLIGTEKTPIEDLNSEKVEVRSMYPAFAQCELWLDKHLPLAKRIELYDTAYSVKNVIEEGSPLNVAIGGKYAAEVYGGEIIEGPINDNKNNHTRFILLTKDKQETKDANRTSLILTIGHTEGSLYRVLGAFAEEGINLSKLDSHPIPSDERYYLFYIDIEVGIDSEQAQRAIKKITDTGSEIKVLGSYKV